MFKRAIFVAFSIILVVLVFGSIYILQQLCQSKPNGQLVTFVIEKGEGVKEIGENLKKKDLIKSELVFQGYIYLKNNAHKFQAGEYNIAAGLGLKKVIQKLTSGQAISDEQEITIIEGWNSRKIASYLEEADLAATKDFLAAISEDRTWRQDYDFLATKPKEASLEGYLFPDTYRIYKNATVYDIIKKMLDNFDQKLTAQMRIDIKASGRDLFEIITMASIIELEVPDSADRKMIADIFWRRADNGVPLQSDATINYITGKGDPTPAQADLEIDSPYNTYLYPDLPPGPIGNPGLSAIEAAIYPEPNDYWFYLSAPDGQTIYSKTHDEHVRNKQKWLK